MLGRNSLCFRYCFCDPGALTYCACTMPFVRLCRLADRNQSRNTLSPKGVGLSAPRSGDGGLPRAAPTAQLSEGYGPRTFRGCNGAAIQQRTDKQQLCHPSVVEVQSLCLQHVHAIQCARMWSGVG